jgi:hypothetical protein
LLINIGRLLIGVDELFIVLGVRGTRRRHWEWRKLDGVEGDDENHDRSDDNVEKNEEGQLVADPLQRLQLSTRV